MERNKRISFYRLAIICCLLLSVSGLRAQLPVLSNDNDIYKGTVNPAKVEKLHQEFFGDPESPFRKTDKPVELNFYRTFKELFELAPYSSYNFYTGYLFDGDKSVFMRLLNGTSDVATKAVLVEDLVGFCHNMVDNLDSINVLRRTTMKLTENDSISMPVAMTRYAHYYYILAGNPKFYPVKLYDKEQARENFRSAFHMLRARNANPGAELEGIYLNEYYRTCEELYRSDEKKYYEQFLQDYLEIVQACDNLLIPYYDVPDSIKNKNHQFLSYNYYTNHQIDGIKALFKNSGAATPERLSAYYDKQLNDHRRDSAYLNRAINLMNENGCSQTETFYSYCDASYAIKPTYLNCIGCANSSKALKMRQEMINFFLEAKKLATTDLQRGLIAYMIGKETYTYGKRPVNRETNRYYATGSVEYKKWEENTTLASANFMQVLQYQGAFVNSSSIAVRQIPARAAYELGQINLEMAQIMSSRHECDNAEQYFNMAMVAAPDLFNNSDTQFGPKRLNKVKDERQKIMKEEANKRQNALKQKLYDEYMRKKKADEIFWGQ